jgi:repressor LexA
MSLTELALNIGMSKQSLSAYSLGIRNPKQPTIKAISELLHVNPAWLIGYDVPKYLDIMPSNIIPITGMVPIYGSIPAGVPVFAEQNIEGYMPIMLKNPQEYFCLLVKGDSMINAHITSNSLVVIHHQNTAENGEIVACRVNGDEATLKRFKQLDDIVLLITENSAYEPVIVSCKDFEDGHAEIIGVVKQTVLDVK